MISPEKLPNSLLSGGTAKIKTLQGNVFDVWALGITIVIGGGYFSWNKGLTAGFGSFAIATFLSGTAYICLTLGTSEMLSTLPFAGGAYGIARCTLGFFPGYLVGCMDAVEYIIYTSLAAEALISMLSKMLGIGNTYNPLLMVAFYVVSCSLHIRGGKCLWQFVRVIGVISLLISVFYCLGSLAFVDFSRNTTTVNEQYFIGGMSGFLKSLPLASWFYVGIESLAFSCDIVSFPKITVPKGMICSIITIFLMSIAVLFISSSLSPGIQQTSQANIIFNVGFSLFLKCSQQFATILSLPATFGTGFGFVFAYGNLLYALASSKLVPKFFLWKGESNTPFAAIISGSFLSYVICVLVNCLPNIQAHLFDLCILNAYVSYCTQCIGYIILKSRFRNLERQFVSPLGIWGALYAFIVFAFSGIAVIGFLKDKQVALICFVVLLCLLSWYYFLHVKNRQTFSPDEERILFVAHVMNYNSKAAHRRRVGVPEQKTTKNSASSKKATSTDTSFAASKRCTSESKRCEIPTGTHTQTKENNHSFALKSAETKTPELV